MQFLFVMFSRAMASGKRIAEVLDEKIDIADPENPADVRVERGEIEFKNGFEAKNGVFSGARGGNPL